MEDCHLSSVIPWPTYDLISVRSIDLVIRKEGKGPSSVFTNGAAFRRPGCVLT
jgi:hypothetical protein